MIGIRETAKQTPETFSEHENHVGPYNYCVDAMCAYYVEPWDQDPNLALIDDVNFALNLRSA